MVLKNSKWDKKAKKKFEKKHGVNQKHKEPINTPKKHWSGKKQVAEPDSDSEWDSETDAPLLEHFYPLMGSDTSLTRDQKIKLKKQIITDIQRQLEQEENAKEEIVPAHNYEDGIYLGSLETQAADDRAAAAARAIAEAREHDLLFGTLTLALAADMALSSEPRSDKFNMADFLEDLQEKLAKKHRRMPVKGDDTQLDEYGISHRDLVKDGADYNDVSAKKRQQRSAKAISDSELKGHVIGEQFATPEERRSQVRVMTDEEKAEEKRRNELAEKNEFYLRIKNKLGAKAARDKVLEINNFDNTDTAKVGHLRHKIDRYADEDDGNWEDDLNELIGGVALEKEEKEPVGTVVALAPAPAKTDGVKVAKKADTDFLDSLLG